MYLLIDIGGSWIKGVLSSGDQPDPQSVVKVKSPFNEQCELSNLMDCFNSLFQLLKVPDKLDAVAVSCAGVVNYSGTKIINCVDYLEVLKTSNWRELLSERFSCPVVLINDADAALIGTASQGHLKGDKCIGIFVIGTGLGFAIWRNGLRWRPQGKLPLLGSVQTPVESYNSLVSTRNLTDLHPENDLKAVLTESEYTSSRENYFKNFAGVIESAVLLYDLDEVLITGGLIDAANDADFDIIGELERSSNPLYEQEKTAVMKTLNAGNLLQLIGVLELAKGEAVSTKVKYQGAYSDLISEAPYKAGLQLQRMSAKELVANFYEAEQVAGVNLQESLDSITQVAGVLARTIVCGGRLIYVGCGSSGRIASLDMQELTCTFGVPREKLITLISGGSADAAFKIEEEFEEDASAVPEMLLISPGKNDLVIGISASGSAYYVRSALALAKSCGAHTAFISNMMSECTFFDDFINLQSGPEVINGSTRLKAGTATKKILNAITSTAMVMMGKVEGEFMIDMACINEKLINRAVGIIGSLYGSNPEESLAMLKHHKMNLRSVVESFR